MKLAGHNCRVQADGKYIYLWTPYSLKDECRSMVGATWDNKLRCWKVKKCRRNVMQLEILSGGWPKEFERYKLPIKEYEPNRDCLWKHQRKGLNFALTRQSCILAMEMAGGKTLIAIELMEAVGGEWYYVSRKAALASTELELRKWKAKVIPRLLTYDQLKKVVMDWIPGNPPPTGIILDESSMVKNSQTQRWKAVKHLTDAMREEHGDKASIILMTGTPAPKDPTDWWAQVELVAPGWLRESRQSLFRNRVMLTEPTNYGSRSFLKVVGVDEEERKKLSKRLEGVVWVHLLDEKELPEPHHMEINLTPPDEMIRAARILIEGGLPAAHLLIKLRQLSDGFYEDKELPTPKEEALKNLLEIHEENGRLIVYAAFTKSVDRVVRICKEQRWKVIRCDGRGWINKERLKDMSVSGDSSDKLVFVGQPGAGGMGLNLQGAKGLIYWSNDFNGESRTQSQARVRRHGMMKGTIIYDLLCLGTDSLVLSKLKEKRKIELTTLEEIKEALCSLTA